MVSFVSRGCALIASLVIGLAVAPGVVVSGAPLGSGLRGLQAIVSSCLTGRAMTGRIITCEVRPELASLHPDLVPDYEKLCKQTNCATDFINFCAPHNSDDVVVARSSAVNTVEE